MKWILIAAVSLGSFGLQAQRDLTPDKKNKAFGGAQDYRDYNLYGFQVQLGGTYLLNRLNNETIAFDPNTTGFRGTYEHDPIGKLGAFVEVGMFHFPKKRSKLSEKLKFIFVSYYDWGVGFKYFRGAEDITVNNADAIGNTISTEEQRFNFSNGNVYGRFTLHKNVYFTPKKRREKLNFFLDNGLGVNFDYRVLTTSDTYEYDSPLSTSFMTNSQQYYKPFYAQLHYSLGFGFSPKRGSFLIPTIQIPLLGYQSAVPQVGSSDNAEKYFGKPSMHWFSSRYWPIMFSVKYMFALPKKSKGCATGITNDQDKDTQNNR